MLAYATYYAKMDTAISATMTNVTVEGFKLDVDCSSASSVTARKVGVLVPYNPPLEKASDIRKVSVAMHFEAFHGLGFVYKVQHGYYAVALSMLWSKIFCKKVKLVGVIVAVLACAICFFFLPDLMVTMR